jgi:hypothetical protein
MALQAEDIQNILRMRQEQHEIEKQKIGADTILTPAPAQAVETSTIANLAAWPSTTK